MSRGPWRTDGSVNGCRCFAHHACIVALCSMRTVAQHPKRPLTASFKALWERVFLRTLFLHAARGKGQTFPIPCHPFGLIEISFWPLTTVGACHASPFSYTFFPLFVPRVIFPCAATWRLTLHVPAPQRRVHVSHFQIYWFLQDHAVRI